MEASGGEEALETLQQESPDLVITDIRMPGTDGLTLLAKVKERFPDLPLLGISGMVNDDDINEYGFGRGSRTRPCRCELSGSCATSTDTWLVLSHANSVITTESSSAVAGRVRRHSASYLIKHAGGVMMKHRDLEDRERLLLSIHKVIGSVLPTMTLDAILDNVSQALLQAGIFRSIMIALVDRATNTVEVVTSVVAFESGGRARRLRNESIGVEVKTGAIGLSYSLDDDNITAQVARTGKMAVISEWNERLDARVDTKKNWATGGAEGKVAYFIPLIYGDEVIAVVATGSLPEEQRQVLERIEMIQPLLDLVAASLHHARQTRDLEDAHRRLVDLHEISRLTVSSLDREQILDTLGRQVVRTGVLRSLMVALVDRPARRVTVVRSFTRRTDHTFTSEDAAGHSYDLDDDNITAEIARTGEAQTIVGWDDRFTRNVPHDTPDRRQGHVAYFIPIKSLDEVVAVAATGSRVEDQEETGRLIVELQPLWDQVAIALSNAELYESLQREISERNDRLRQTSAVARVREQVLVMERDEDLDKVLMCLQESLRDAGLHFTTCGINLLDLTQSQPKITFYDSTMRKWFADHAWGAKMVEKMWREGKVAYRTESTHPAELARIGRALGHGVRSVADVPFSSGTLAINSAEPDAFSAADFEILETMAEILSVGVQRMQDLRSLEDRNREMEDTNRRLEALRQVRTAIWRMRNVDEAVQLIDALQTALRVMDISFHDCGINLVDTSGPKPVSRQYYADEKIWRTVEDEHEVEVVLMLWCAEKPTYRRDLATDDVHGEQDHINAEFGTTIRSVVDVPFYQGTFAVNSTKPDAFSERDIAFIQELTDVVAEGFRRLDDLRNLERQNRSLTREVAERRRLEEQVIHSERQSASIELAAGVSHNLNNVLTGVMAPAEILLMCSDDPEVRIEAESIKQAGEKVRDLVRRLSDAVRSHSADPARAVDLNRQIEETIQLARPRWKDAPESEGISIRMVTNLGDIPNVRGSGSEISEVILNLLFNAVDAMPGGGTITVSTDATEDDFVSLSVSDDGAGMDEDTRRRVFEPFFTTKVDVGSGLGLSTAYGTVIRSGGSVDVTSEVGQGTVFTIRLPVHEPVDGIEPEAVTDRPVRSGRILLVEDDQMTCDVLQRILSPRHTVEVVRSGPDALQTFTPGRFDVALIDLGIPAVPGDQVASNMREQDPALATVLLTGWVLEQDDPRLSDFDLRLQKPIRGPDLEETVCEAMELHDSRFSSSR